MATNKIQQGQILDLALEITAVSGDPVKVGQIRGVALTAGSAGTSIPIDTSGVYDLSVEGANLAGSAGAGVAISVGDKIYFNSALTPKLLASTVTGTLFGIALEAVAASATDTINVKLLGVSQQS